MTYCPYIWPPSTAKSNIKVGLEELIKEHLQPICGKEKILNNLQIKRSGAKPKMCV